jgi:hypothetical protein
VDSGAWRSIGLKMSPVRRKCPPWELMARATKYEPQVGASVRPRVALAAYDVNILSTANDVIFSSTCVAVIFQTMCLAF